MNTAVAVAGVLLALTVITLLQVAAFSAIALIWLNWVGGFGLSFWQIVGIGGLSAAIATTPSTTTT